MYLMPSEEAIASEDFPAPRLFECTAEWQRPVKFLLYIVDFGAYVNTK